jgi:hypothetical protein
MEMSGDSDIERGPRARPVADAPVDALLARVDELARRWAIALLLARPLREMAEVPLEELAREAPALCAQAIRALDSDAELERLAVAEESGGRGGSAWASRLGASAGVLDARAVVYEVEALRGVLWEALLEELDRPIFDQSSARLVADLSDRLAHVCATALATMLTPGLAASADEPWLAPRVSHQEPLYTSQRASQGRSAAVLVDEREDVPSPPRAAGAGVAAPAPAEAIRERPLEPSEARRRSEATGAQTRPRPLPWDTPSRAERRPPQARTEASGPAKATPGGDPVMRITRHPSAPVDEQG